MHNVRYNGATERKRKEIKLQKLLKIIPYFMLKIKDINEFVCQNMYRNMHKNYAKQLLFLFNNVCMYVYLYSIKIIFNTFKGDGIIFTPLKFNLQMLQIQQNF